jgi:nucleoside-diphosphate-sugar epimerase
MRRILVTGSAGFIGFHLSQLLLEEGLRVVGYDGMTDYYDVRIKQRRHQMLLQHPQFSCTEGMLEDFDRLHALALSEKPDVIVHLAAQAGVRYSLENPRAYIDANLIGTFNVMECARELGVDHLLMASTQFGLRRQHRDALRRGAEMRHAAHPLRRDQEGERGDGAFLRAPVGPAGDDVPLLHRLRAVGAARHGAVQVYPRDPRRHPDRHLQ